MRSVRTRIERLEQRVAPAVRQVVLEQLVRASMNDSYAAWLAGEVQAGRIVPGELVRLILDAGAGATVPLR